MKWSYSLIGTLLINSTVLATEPFATLMSQQVVPFWLQLKPQQLTLSDGSSLPYMLIKPEAVKATVVLVNGRTESYLKYQQLAYELVQQGYQVLMFDHRGQGLSKRLTDNVYKGHIEDFQQYVDDMHQLISRIILPGNHLPLYLLGHSMGGAISTLYLEQHPDVFQKAALSAPMLGIQGKLLYDEQDACRLASVVSVFTSQGYAGFADKPYQPAPFSSNDLTGSAERYQWNLELYQSHPEIQLGGATWGWLDQACTVLPKIQQQAKNIKIPLLLMQAELDSIVSASAQQSFCSVLAGNAKLGCVGGVQVIKGAQHELLFEQEGIRQSVIDKIVAHFSEN